MNAFPSATVRTLLRALLPLILAGCAGTPVPPDAGAAHPANPGAAASPVPPWQPGLLAITNMVMVKPVPEPAPEHQHDHEKKKNEAKPQTEERK